MHAFFIEISVELRSAFFDSTLSRLRSKLFWKILVGRCGPLPHSSWDVAYPHPSGSHGITQSVVQGPRGSFLARECPQVEFGIPHVIKTLQHHTKRYDRPRKPSQTLSAPENTVQNHKRSNFTAHETQVEEEKAEILMWVLHAADIGNFTSAATPHLQRSKEIHLLYYRIRPSIFQADCLHHIHCVFCFWISA